MSATFDILATLTHEQAQQYVGTVFRLVHEAVPDYELKLHEVVLLMPNRPRSSRLKRDSFSMYFTGGPLLLPQAIYKLTSDAISFDGLFLVPLSRNDDGTYEYEAVFT